MTGTQDDTPLMQQWREAKSRHQDALVFFRVGDFYEMFNEDAQEGARLLGLTLTSRNNGGASQVPLAGIPVKAKDEYLQRLVRMGRRVAICEQVEDPAEAKGIVRREVVETITPGAILSDSLLSADRNNFLVALAGDDVTLGVAAADVSTGELVGTLVPVEQLEATLARFEPAELLVAQAWDDLGPWPGAERASVTHRPDWLFDADLAGEELRRHFHRHALDGFGFQEGDAPMVRALGALLAYLRDVRAGGAEQLRPPRIERPGDAMALDEMTRRNLELVEPLRADAPPGGTLFDVLDETVTAMGTRLLRRWLLRPLLVAERIWQRQDAVAELVEDPPLRRGLRVALREIRDMERLAARVGAGRVNPRELRALADSLGRLPQVRDILDEPSSVLLAELAELDVLDDVLARIDGALVDEPPVSLADGGVIRAGHDGELDELRATRDGARDFIASLQARERERTGIQSLKVGYNKVFGYYLEVTKANLDRVPDDYVRKQTLANGERYFTDELKEWEEKVLRRRGPHRPARGASSSPRLREAWRKPWPGSRRPAARVATLDVLAGLAVAAERRGYVRPEVHTGYRLAIRGGTPSGGGDHDATGGVHPQRRRPGRGRRIIVLTGPNMAGKSTAAPAGRPDPAAGADGRVRTGPTGVSAGMDRIFTRVGASDNLARGQSTFMVEMSESAAILSGATDHSLVLLDEIGRGTATYDGVSIAWAMTEHLHEVVGVKTIFATHYHELTQLADQLPALVNYNVAVKEAGDDIVFLRHLEPGGADRSYGIQVGRLAGLPADVVERAREILRELEDTHSHHGEGLGRHGQHRPAAGPPPDQLSLFAVEHPVVKRLRNLDIDGLTPLQALNLLSELREEADAKE